MDVSKLENIINDAWENRDTISTDTKGEVRKSVEEALNGLDSGLFRVAEPIGNHQWKVPSTCPRCFAQNIDCIRTQRHQFPNL